MLNSFMGVRVIITPHATRKVWHWPDKKRSRRLIKKLTKLRGPQVTIEPAAYVMADGRMAMHPHLAHRLRNIPIGGLKGGAA